MIKQLYTPSRVILLLAVMLMVAGKLASQIAISGPQCILPGITYQYNIKGTRSDSSVVRVNIKGGALTGGISTSTDRVKVSAVFVTWGDTAYHRIEVQSGKGNANLLVQQTTPLIGGEIKATHNIQRYDTVSAGYSFQCSLPTGGSCTPNYTYQWQKSEDAMKWTDIAGATGKDLLFSQKLDTDTYFRRVTTESKSNTMGFSDVGLLYIVH